MMHKNACALAVVLALAVGAFAYEVRVSRLNSWELTFECNPPRVIRVNNSSQPQEYTYVVYKVTNNTSQDVDFFPTFQIEADDETVTSATVSPKVAKLVSERFGRKILDSNQVRGVLKPGETRDGLAVFSGVDPASDTLTLYAYGLSGDLKVSRDAEGKVHALYRTYKLVYARPGDEFIVSIDPVTLKSAEWVWRQ